MGVAIASEVLATILAAAAADPAHEVCGLLFGTPDRIEAAIPCANVAAESARRFEIDPITLIAAYRVARDGGPALIGHYHSHPTGIAIPSACDAESAMGDGAVWLIVAGGTVRGWRSVEVGAFAEEALAVVDGSYHPSPRP